MRVGSPSGDSVHPRRMIRLGVAGLAVAGLGGLLFMSGTEIPAQAVDAPVRTRAATAVEFEEVAAQKRLRQIVVPGIVQARSRMQLSFDVGGRIAKFFVEEGDAIAAGRPIAILDLSDLTRELELARAALARSAAQAEEARAFLERQRDLLGSRTISQQAFDRAMVASEVSRAGAREAELLAELAATRLDKGTLRAPVSGYIERRLAEAHEQTEAGAPVVVLTELDTVRVRASLPDRQARTLRIDAPAVVSSPAWPARQFEGRIAQIDLAADPATRTWPFEVELSNPELRLRPELSVDVSLVDGDDAEALTLPLAAVLRDAELRPFCFVARGEDPRVAERRELVLGDVLGERVKISDGIRPGDRVVVRGQHFLRPGDPLGVAGQ